MARRGFSGQVIRVWSMGAVERSYGEVDGFRRGGAAGLTCADGFTRWSVDRYAGGIFRNASAKTALLRVE